LVVLKIKSIKTSGLEKPVEIKTVASLRMFGPTTREVNAFRYLGKTGFYLASLTSLNVLLLGDFPTG
jgi:hypothetical protein